MAVDPQQAALAAALAQHGSAGIQQAADQTGAAGKSAAMAGAASRAGLINAPTDFLKQAATQTAAPYNNAAKSAANTTNAINSYTNTLQGATDNYNKQAQGSMGLLQKELDKSAGAQNFAQMLQLYNLQQQQAMKAPQLQAEQDALALENNQKTVMNKILAHPNTNLRDTAIDAINSNSSGTLAGALSQLSGEDTKKNLKKLGIDENELRQTLTEYYSDPQSYSSLQSALAARPSTPAAAPAAGGGGLPPLDFMNGLKVLSKNPGALARVAGNIF
jgi:hypothetical protein